MQDQLEQGDGVERPAAARVAHPEELAMLLYQALLHGDDAMMRALARQAVSRYAGMEPAARSAAPTTCTGPCATSTSTACSNG